VKTGGLRFRGRSKARNLKSSSCIKAPGPGGGFIADEHDREAVGGDDAEADTGVMRFAVRIHSDQGGGEGGLDSSGFGRVPDAGEALFSFPMTTSTEAVVIEIKPGGRRCPGHWGRAGLAGEEVFGRAILGFVEVRNLTLAPCLVAE